MIIAEGAYAKRNKQAKPAVSAGIIRATQTTKIGDMEAQITRWYAANGTKLATPGDGGRAAGRRQGKALSAEGTDRRRRLKMVAALLAVVLMTLRVGGRGDDRRRQRPGIGPLGHDRGADRRWHRHDGRPLLTSDRNGGRTERLEPPAASRCRPIAGDKLGARPGRAAAGEARAPRPTPYGRAPWVEISDSFATKGNTLSERCQFLRMPPYTPSHGMCCIPHHPPAKDFP